MIPQPAPPPYFRSPLLLLAACLLALAVTCHGHAFLLSPLSRARGMGRDEYTASAGNGLGTWPFRKNPDGSNLNDQPDVCGDPHQDAGDLNLRSSLTDFQATYSPGAVITITFRARVNHGGWFGVRLCPETRSNPSQACFDRHVLTNTDKGYQRWWITDGRFGTQTDYTTHWRLPDGVSCDGGCVLQMIYRTANSCVDPCSSAECGPSYAARSNPVTGQTRLDSCGPARTEVFRDCADVRIITGGSGSGSGTVTPSSCTRTYTVRDGDTCFKIAQSQGTSVAAIFSLNPAVNSGCTNLQIGQRLCLAGGGSSSSTAGTSADAGCASGVNMAGKDVGVLTSSTRDSCKLACTNNPR
ncbi:hypothetical protein GPECTOR_655g775 [Gonium pectorale]|uniref:LysM domain-containing protein n=1 Tax=Gonium pectorale TaxID=33097 RepID=A0A150FU81_GONPE|nr:hypothetical protein GPECTOR_655g775 [Gonium pectorale]|eukprot:KXZ41203.1 hypothetical protein GPECTOR_655g775 [Gonium pectorale]